MVQQVKRYKCQYCDCIQDVKHQGDRKTIGQYIKCKNKACVGCISSGTMKLQMEFILYDENLLNKNTEQLIQIN